MGFLFWRYSMKTKLQMKKEKLAKKLGVKDITPGSLIRKANSLPKPNTKLGLSIRGLI